MPPSLDLAPGERLGGILIERLVTRGESGEIYRGRHEKLRRPVAVKSVRHGSASARTRLLAEAQLLSQLEHPNICRAYDFLAGRDRDVLVLELVEGRTLGEMIREDCTREDCIDFDPRLVPALARQITSALAAIHERGLVHGDLRPANVMVTHVEDPAGDRAADGRIKLLGFAYEPEAAEPADDMSAFGDLLRELLAAAAPWRRSVRGYAALAVLGRRLAAEPPAARPSAAEALAVLEKIERAPLRRRMWALAAALLVTLGGGLRLSYAPADVPRDESVPGTVEAAMAAQVPRVVLGSFVNETGEAILDTTLDVALRAGLEQSRRLHVLSPESLRQVLKRMNRPPASPIDRELGLEICRREGAGALVLGTIFRSGSGYKIIGEILDPKSGAALAIHPAEAADSDAIFTALDEISREIRGVLGDSAAEIAASRPLAQVTTSHLGALEAYHLAEEESVSMVDGDDRSSVVALLERALEIDPGFAMAHAKLGVHHFVHKDPARARGHIERAIELSERLSDYEKLYIEGWRAMVESDPDEIFRLWTLATRRHPNRYEGFVNLGAAYANVGDLDEALAVLERGLPFVDPGQRQFMLRQILACHLALGQYDAVRAELRELPEPSRGFVEVYYLLAVERHDEADAALIRVEYPAMKAWLRSLIAADQGQWQESLAWLPSGTDESYGLAPTTRVALLMAADRHEEAVPAAREALEATWEKVDPGRYLLAPFSVIAVLGKDLAQAGALAEAQAVRTRLAAVVEPTGFPYWQSSARALEGDILFARGREAEALVQLEEALRVNGSLPVRDSLARVYEALGDLEAAIDQNEWIVDHRGRVLDMNRAALTAHHLVIWHRALERLEHLYATTGQSDRSDAVDRHGPEEGAGRGLKVSKPPRFFAEAPGLKAVSRGMNRAASVDGDT